MNNSYQIQRDFQILLNENQLLRTKTNKINQIQSYVNILIQSNQNYQTQNLLLGQQNQQLKNRINKLMSEGIQMEKMFEDELRQLQGEFFKQLNKKDEQIKLIAQAKEKDHKIFEQQLTEHQIRSKNDIQRIKIQVNHMQQEYEIQIKRLNQYLNDKSKELEKQKEMKNQMRHDFIKQAEGLHYQMSRLSKGHHELKSQNAILNEQVIRLRSFSVKAKDQEVRLNKQLMRLDEEFECENKNRSKEIMMLEKERGQLVMSLQRVKQKLRGVEGQVERLRKENGLLNEESYALKGRQTKLNNIVEEKQEMIMQMKRKILEDQEQYKRHGKRSHDQLVKVEEELVLANQRLEVEKKANGMRMDQIKDLIQVVDKLQMDLQQNQQKVMYLNNQNSVLFKQVENLTKQIQKVTKQQAILYENQRNKLIENHLHEKRQILESHRLQNENLTRKHQNALREKDDQAKRRLEMLQDEINLIRLRH